MQMDTYSQHSSVFWTSWNEKNNEINTKNQIEETNLLYNQKNRIPEQCCKVLEVRKPYSAW